MATATPTGNGKTDGPSAAELDEQIRQLRTDITELAHTMRGMGDAKARDFKKRARGKAEEISAGAEDALTALTDQLEEIERQVGRKVRKNPFAALGIAAGVGFLVAMLARR
ncbi:ElaB/YqjD/DUF883 family membrane-anchored ribosome-binding protein [Rhodobium orientis]|uniref:DUF883 domain-containing protein n=1 Tax=Rhodobium orientis TaxID=34017 RepID=A0A327JW43_9HYPH|nr:DUF883 family protein [Rhodobium orientis]MBB4302723.1 ElaB/YqjD/DUF883 family membrane-anchored ribosome-binding protein [Rhodobium orientis]MBK5948505.1 hypothetical protein [Rhodobium orientis]RAI29774.1 hypothetical protein CH339_01795 [Rhodobium orientis]